jgi:FkbM family methyltransferase
MIYKQVPSVSIPGVIDRYLQDNEGEKLYFILVGANNGEQQDFITDAMINASTFAILIEPVHEYFLKLKDKYNDGAQVFLENYVVSWKSGKRILYRLKTDESLPAWSSGLGSFYKEVIEVHGNQIPFLQRNLIKEYVRCIALNDLIAKHHLPKINIIQIDTEGYDYEILKVMEVQGIFPDIVIYEYLHVTFNQYFSSIALLEKMNYRVLNNTTSTDIIAVRKDLLP